MADEDFVIEFDEAGRTYQGEPLEKGVEVADDGDGLVIDLEGGDDPEIIAELMDAPFEANLAELLPEETLADIGSTVEDHVREDRAARGDWEDTQRKGMSLLGLKYEERTEPWEGACGAFHPMLLESVLSFQAQTTSEVLPAKGPAKYEIVGRVTAEKEKQGKRITRDLNYLTMKKIPGYKDETKQLFFKVPIAGTIYRKIWYDPVRKVPRVQNILPENFLMPYGATCIDTAPHYTIVLDMEEHEIEKLQLAGFYRDVDLGSTSPRSHTDLQDERDYVQGESEPAANERTERELYECYMQLKIEGAPEGGESTKPYIVTVDRSSSEVLGIYRNWKQEDDTFEALKWGSKWTYMPGFSIYGTSIIQILGGLSDSATSILRQLIDAGTLANIPAGFKAKELRIKGDNQPIMPGEWRDVEAMGGALRDNFLPLPYKEPSGTLHALLQNVVDEGRRLGATADAKISDIGSQQMPVGTALAILESVTKMMSGVARNMYDAMGEELEVLARVVKDYMPEQYPFELNPGEEKATRPMDYDAQSVDVLPISNPNASTMAMRIMKTQAVMQLSSQEPELYDKPALHKRMLVDMQVDDFEELLPGAGEVKPRDPVTENMDIITGKPVRAGPEQDHEAHIQVHMNAIEDPKLKQLISKSPGAPAIMAAAAAHIAEHVAFQYRREIEKSLGAPLPPPGEPLPEDVEYQLAQLTAQASEKVLGRHEAEIRQKEIMDKMEDPMVQQRERELDLKEADQKRKERETGRRLDLQAEKQAIDAQDSALDRNVEVVRTLLDAQIRHDETVSKEQVEGVKTGVKLVADLEKSMGANSKGTGNQS